VKEDDDCWEWQGDKNAGGYGRFSLHGKKVLAHRFALLGYDVLLPKQLLGFNKLVCHKCDNPACCNPNHLYRGTQTDNMKDRFERSNDKISIKVRGIRDFKKSIEISWDIENFLDGTDIS